MADAQDMTETLRQAIRDCGYSQSELARRTGVHLSRVNHFVNGKRDLTFKAVAVLCAELGLELRPVRRKKTPG